jgi:hypothetical protein
VWHVPQIGGGGGELCNNISSVPPVSARRAAAFSQHAPTLSTGPVSPPEAALPFLPPGSVAAARVSAVATNTDLSFFLSVVSVPTEEAKLWTLDSAGGFVQWRAAVDDNPSSAVATISSVSMRRRLECPGASSVQVNGLFACLAAPQDRAWYLVDVTTFVVLHRVTVTLPPTSGPQSWALCPDGRTVVIGAQRNGSLLAFDVTSGVCITPPDGCPRARAQFQVDFIAWSRNKQLALVASSNGLSMARTEIMDEDGDGSLVSVLGRPRNDDEVILEADPKAADYVRTTFGGQMQLSRGTAHTAPSGGPRSALRAAHKDESGVVPRLRLISELEDDGRPAALRSDNVSRVDQILSYWKGLVSKHKDPADKARTTKSTSKQKMTLANRDVNSNEPV